MRSLVWSGYCAAQAEPYAQAVALAEAGCFVAATGLGGGAATYMPAELVRRTVEDAVRGEPRSREASRLARIFERVDAEMGRIVDADEPVVAMYRGSGAEMVAALEGDGVVWVGSAGVGRAWRITREGLQRMTRDDSLFEHFLETHPTQEAIDRFAYHGVSITMLDGRWRSDRPDWKPISVPIEETLGVLLMTSDAHEHVSEAQLGQWVLDMLDAPALDQAARTLWERLRDHLETSPDRRSSSLSNFERRAAVMLLRT